RDRGWGRRSGRSTRRAAGDCLRGGCDPAAAGEARRAEGDGDAGAAARLPDPGGDRPRVTRFRLTVEYDGRPFMGWQRQAHGPSVQQVIEEAVKLVTGEIAAVHAAGRTDAGVHAIGMAAHVE